MGRGSGVRPSSRCSSSSATLELDENASDESDFLLVHGVAPVSRPDSVVPLSSVVSLLPSSSSSSSARLLAKCESSASSSSSTSPVVTQSLSSRNNSLPLPSFSNTVTVVPLASVLTRKRKIDKEEKESVEREGRKTKTEQHEPCVSEAAVSTAVSSGEAVVSYTTVTATSSPTGPVSMVFGRQYVRTMTAPSSDTDVTDPSSHRHQFNHDDDKMLPWQPSVSTDVDHGLAADFDDSLTGLGGNLSSSTYNMSEALLALPSISNMSSILKNEAPSVHSENSQQSAVTGSCSEGAAGSTSSSNHPPTSSSCVAGISGTATTSNGHVQQQQRTRSSAASSSAAAAVLLTGRDSCRAQHRFQYILNAATSIATKLNEESLTYLNQAQSYELRVKQLGDISTSASTVYRTKLKLCFHERRLQYIEKEQLEAWRNSRPGDRLLEVDVPPSYGIYDVRQSSAELNCCEFLWTPNKDVGVYIKVNSVSTEFTPKKHGGEKGVPFRLQAETYSCSAVTDSATSCPSASQLLHCAASQIKVFKLKGGDRKHRQDRERLLRRSPSALDRYQPSFECTVLTETPLDLVHASPTPPPSTSNVPSAVRPSSPPPPPAPAAPPPPAPAASRCVVTPASSHVPVGGRGGRVEEASQSLATTAVNHDSRTTSSLSDSTPDNEATVCCTSPSCGCGGSMQLSSCASVAATGEWLVRCRLGRHASSSLANYSAADLMRMSRNDALQLCGLTDGVRLFNCLHIKMVPPRVTLYVSVSRGSAVFHALFLYHSTARELATKLSPLLAASAGGIGQMFVQGPCGVHVVVTDEVVKHLKNESLYNVLVLSSSGDDVSVLLRHVTSSLHGRTYRAS